MDCKTITLRTRVLKHGMLGFYLDFYPGYRDRETIATKVSIFRYTLSQRTNERKISMHR